MSYRSMRGRSKAEAPSKIVLPITPMLDMTFQLLFFCIVNFKPMPPEGVMETALPSEKVTQNIKEKTPDKKDQVDTKEPDFPSDLTVKVRTQLQSGEISNLAVLTNEGKEEQVGSKLESLEPFLLKKRESLTNKNTIKVQGDSALKVRNLIAVADACRKAGFKDVSFVTPDDFGR
jgi:biopolymer transport protein ExbD